MKKRLESNCQKKMQITLHQRSLKWPAEFYHLTQKKMKTSDKYISFNSIEKEYLSKNIWYWSSQKILESFSKKDLFQEIQDMERIYQLERNKLLKEYKKIISKDSYINGSEMDKYFIRTVFNTFYWWVELNLYKNLINKFKMYYKINHTDFYKWSSYIPFDINSAKIKDVISMYVRLPNNSTRRNIHCPIHRDKSPSFKIYEKNNSYYCFGCKSWWNPANFIADIESITYKQAFKKLVNLYN